MTLVCKKDSGAELGRNIATRECCARTKVLLNDECRLTSSELPFEVMTAGDKRHLVSTTTAGSIYGSNYTKWQASQPLTLLGVRAWRVCGG